MPAVLPALVGAVVSELYGAVIGALAAAASSAIVANQQRQAANRRARDAWNSGLRDQTILVRGGVNPRPIVYGRTAVGGQLVYAETFGTKKEHLLLVVALAHGEVDAVEEVYFNDQLLTIDGSNNVTSAPYGWNSSAPGALQTTIPGSPYQVTLPQTPDSTVLVQDMTYGTGGGDSGPPRMLVEGVDFSRSGAVLTFNAAESGKVIQASYTFATSASYAAVWRFTGAPGQDLSTTMLALGAPSWTSADKCQGMAALIVKLSFLENLFPTGIPAIRAVIRGRKVYDPRSATTVYSANAALCARDYLTFQYGLAAASGRIDDTVVSANANICDEDVQIGSGPSVYQKRYTVNGVISTGDDRLTNLAKFEQAMAGNITDSAGKWRIRAGAYTAPALTLDESKLAPGSIEVVPFASRRDLLNAASGVYLDSANQFVEGQSPQWTGSAFVAEDNGEVLTSALAMPLIGDSIRAQRLAKIAVYRSRETLTLRCSANFSCYPWQVGDMVSVTLARYGFSAKPFRLIERGFSLTGAMRFTLREEPSGLYNWDLGEATVLTGAGNTVLPDPTVVGAPTITGITSAQWLYKAGDGTFVARIRVAVTPPADQYVQSGGKLQLQYKRGDWTGDWVLLEAAGDATAIWIDPAFDAQNYLIRVRAVNSAGYASAWSVPQLHVCQGRPGQTTNLLQNSDWTDDLGYPVGAYYADARALRHWTAAGTNPATQVFGRNYGGGTAWNVGPGGAWLHNSATTDGQYQYIYQSVPVVPGVAYEASALVSIHRANAIFYLRYLNAAQDTVLAEFADTFNAGAGVVGDAQDTSTHLRMWATGTAPVGAVYAQVLCLMQNTAATATPAYTFWSKAMLCVAPEGVTRATATPWNDGSPSTVDGQLVDTASRIVASVASALDGSGQIIDTFSFTPKASGWMKIRVNAGIVGGSTNGYDRVLDLVIYQATAGYLLSGQQQYVGNLANFRNGWSDNKEVYVIAGQQVDIQVRGYCIGSVDTVTLYSLNYNATVTRRHA